MVMSILMTIWLVSLKLCGHADEVPWWLATLPAWIIFGPIVLFFAIGGALLWFDGKVSRSKKRSR